MSEDRDNITLDARDVDEAGDSENEKSSFGFKTRMKKQAKNA